MHLYHTFMNILITFFPNTFQRAVKHIDKQEEPADKQKSTTKHGHKGILSVDFNAKPENLTTVRESYKIPPDLGISACGEYSFNDPNLVVITERTKKSCSIKSAFNN